MQRKITFEVHVLQGSRWEIHARHRATEKDAAITEARILEKNPNINAVKVIKDVLDPEEGISEEYTVYKSESLGGGGGGGGRPSGGGAARGTRGGGGRAEADDDDDD